MTSEMLQKAREYEQNYTKFADPDRPKFHLTGPIGWINDPNGFSLYKGEYHLFFQYYPYKTVWGPMHWGHAKTSDFVKWEYLPCAMAPDSPFDEAGCFSGSAIETPDGKHLLMYTGVTHSPAKEDGSHEDFQQQCIAIGDGVDYEKFEGNPVIRFQQLPEGVDIHDFRDPHILRMNDRYYVIVGNRPADGSGSLVVYQSEDARNWDYVGVLDACYNELGKMWECPDFFEVDGKHVILVSPQEMAPMGLEFHAGYGTVALIGSFDPEKFAFERETLQAVDYGIDFYAPQVVKTADGRQVMIAWMENWTNTVNRLLDSHLFGAMTLPRELHVREDGRLIQNPVREIEKYRGRKVAYNRVVVHQETNLAGVRGRLLDLTVTVQPMPGQGYEWFKMHLAKDGDHEVTIRFKPAIDTVKIDRSRCGGRYDIVHTRSFLTFDHQGSIKIRVLMDGNCMEVFVNDGEQAATFKLYNKEFANDAISFEADQPVLMDVEKYDINL